MLRPKVDCAVLMQVLAAGAGGAFALAAHVAHALTTSHRLIASLATPPEENIEDEQQPVDCLRRYDQLR